MSLKLYLSAAISACVVTAFAADIDASKIPPASTKTGVTYATDIKPIFEKSCFGCHSSKSQKLKGKLKLDSLETALKGGENGKDIIPGDSAKSPLVAQVAHAGDPDDFMPPKKAEQRNPPLTKDQIGLIRAWIDQGAK
jgi:mono/diheme cytochrome c family protein